MRVRAFIFLPVFLSACVVLGGCATQPTEKPAAQQNNKVQAPAPIENYDPGKTYSMDQIPVLPTGSIVAARVPTKPAKISQDATIQVIVADSENQTEVAPVKAALEKYFGSRVTFNQIPARGFDQFRAILDKSPSMLITIGTEILGLTDIVSTERPTTRFITIGGQIAEPTDNVDAIIWSGASSRAAVVTEKMSFTNSAQWADKAALMVSAVWRNENRGMVYLLG